MCQVIAIAICLNVLISIGIHILNKFKTVADKTVTQIYLATMHNKGGNLQY